MLGLFAPIDASCDTSIAAEHRSRAGRRRRDPHGRPHTLEVNSRVAPADGWLAYPVTSRWIPDAFAGPMGSLLRAMVTAGTTYPRPATIWVRSD
jgi:hypothetical protein